MNRITVYFSSIFLIIICFSCGKTAEDRDNAKKIIGTWSTYENIDKTDSTVYHFSSNNSGYTTRSNETDNFSWEIKRNYLNTYYKKSPSYFIGYDQYNSKGMYKIKSIEATTMEATQELYGGMEATRTFNRLPN